MSQNPLEPAHEENWKTRTYVTGAVLGTILGVLSAYLFNRTAEENTQKRPAEVPTTALLGLVLTVLGMIRQIAELGKEKKK